ncbi:MAG: TrmH family RNA methyltransferase [Candidatus Atribacteria bacterium]|nr:MAG: TrmH family RNA methyltransferase [Candidatus Atribacteria bacterium]
MRKLLNEELDRLSVGEFKEAIKIPVVVVLDNVRSQNNIGSVFRTADAFRLEGIFLCGITATPPHREIHKTALGATESVSWEYYEDTAQAISGLKEKGYHILSVEQAEGAISLENIPLSLDQKYALVFGNEVRGVEQKVLDLSDLCIEIPQYGTKHSLNISVAAGIVLWEVFRKFSL